MPTFGVLLLLLQGALPPESAVAPVRLHELPGYSEGIMFDSSGAAFVSLLHRDKVLRNRAGAAPETWATIEGPNGHKILPDGTHTIAAKHGVLHRALRRRPDRGARSHRPPAAPLPGGRCAFQQRRIRGTSDELYITGAPGDESGPRVLMKLPLAGVHGRSSRALPRAP